MARLRTGQLAISKMGFPGTTRLFRPSGDFEVGNMTDTCQGLATKPVGADRSQVFKSLELGSSKSFAQNG